MDKRLCGYIDVVGGFDTLEAYTQDTSNQGAVVGRVANRIENACFENCFVFISFPPSMGFGIGFRRNFI